MDTDGDASESSRQEVTTTSFESSGTTDNTDSTGDSSSHKLQQMRGDSGYKSLETQSSQQSNNDVSPKSQHKAPPHSLAPLNISDVSNKSPQELAQQQQKSPRSPRMQALALQEHGRSSSLPESQRAASRSNPSSLPEAQPPRRPSRHDPHRSSHYFDRRAAKSASKKRRDFRSPRHQNTPIHECVVPEAESDSRSDQPSGDSFDEPHGPGATAAKYFTFNKIIRTKSGQSARARHSSVLWDYSIDKHSNAVFNAFVQHDSAFDTPPSLRAGARTGGHRHRLDRKNSEALPLRRDRYKRGSRSASMDSNTTGLGPFHKISPQDSIEEEDEEVWQAMSGSVAADQSQSVLQQTPQQAECKQNGGGIPKIILQQDTNEG